MLIFAGLILRLVLASFGTLQLDQGTFIAWSDRLASVGFPRFYEAWSDYLPGYLYILWILAKIKSVVAIDPTILYKLPAILTDMATGYFIYRIVNQKKGEKWGLIASSLYIFNPAIFANSTLWGQIDSLTAFFSVLAIYFLGGNWILSSVFLALGTLVKPQAGFIAILILFLVIFRKWNFGKILLYVLISGTIFILGFIPFAGEKNLALFILERLSQTANQYPYTSVNAFNFWGIIGLWKKDNIGMISLQAIGVFIALVAFSLAFFRRMREEKFFSYRLLSILFLSSFIFLTRMHERHMLPMFAPLAIAVSGIPTLVVAYLGLSSIYLANLKYAYVWISNDFHSIFSNELLTVFSVLAVVFFFLVVFPLPEKFFLIFERLIKRSKEEVKELEFSSLGIGKKIIRVILLLIIIFSLTTRLLFLDSPKKEYFDEVYHAFTARTLLHSDPKAWEWWNDPPEGYAYEWTHPPLAKLAMWGSMKVFGENSFSWRFPEALAGVGIIFMVYLLGKEIFGDEMAGLLSAGVMSLDGLALVMSRIGMNDSYLLLFSLAAIYFFLKDKNFLSAIFLGLAGSSKWSVLWVLPIIFVAHFVYKKKIRPSYLFFFLLPILVYLSTYIPFFTSGHSWDQFIELQKQMWWYHTNLKATHAYSSNPLTWPFLIRPIWLYTSGQISEMVSNIYAMGNPLVFWFGLVSVFISLYYAVLEKSKKLGFVVFSYFALFIPWAGSPRIMFLYHYLPALPFLALSSGFVLRKFSKNIFVFFPLALILFIYFYPHWTGIQIPVWLDNSYYWIDGWR